MKMYSTVYDNGNPKAKAMRPNYKYTTPQPNHSKRMNVMQYDELIEKCSYYGFVLTPTISYIPFIIVYHAISFIDFHYYLQLNGINTYFM